jgi:hypothetical protein
MLLDPFFQGAIKAMKMPDKVDNQSQSPGALLSRETRIAREKGKKSRKIPTPSEARGIRAVDYMDRFCHPRGHR